MNPLSLFLSPLFDQQERWFLWLAPLMALGIIGFYGQPVPVPAIALTLSPLLLCAFWMAKDKGEARILIAALFAISLGFNAAQWQQIGQKTILLESSVEKKQVTGLLLRADPLPTGARLTLANPLIDGLNTEKTPHLIRVKVRTPYQEIPKAGQMVKGRISLWPPSAPILPRGFDFRNHARIEGIGGTGFAYKKLTPTPEEHPSLSLFLRLQIKMDHVRRFFTQAAFNRLSYETAPMTAALLTGQKSAIDDETMTAMRLSGLSHLLSISGLHVSMIALLLFVPLRALLALCPFMALNWPIKKGAAFASMIGTSFYTLLVGADAPTVRSALMTSLVLFAILIDRKTMSMRLVALAAMAIMLAAPSQIFGPSFQLSFAAVLAMVAAFEKQLDHQIKKESELSLPPFLKRLGRCGKGLILTSLIATAATAPFTLFHFQSISFYGVLSNMLAIPLTTLWVMPCLLLTYALAPFHLASWTLSGAGLGVLATIKIAREVASWPYAQLSAPPMPEWAFLLFLCGGLWLCLWRGQVRTLGLLPLICGALYPLTVTLPFALIAPDGNNWAVRLSDGQLAIYGERSDSFVGNQWQQFMGNPPHFVFNEDDPQPVAKDLFCDKERCIFNGPKQMLIFLLPQASAQTIQSSCRKKGDIIITPLILNVPCNSLLIDAKAQKKNGAFALYQKDGELSLETSLP